MSGIFGNMANMRWTDVVANLRTKRTDGEQKNTDSAILTNPGKWVLSSVYLTEWDLSVSVFIKQHTVSLLNSDGCRIGQDLSPDVFEYPRSSSPPSIFPLLLSKCETAELSLMTWKTTM